MEKVFITKDKEHCMKKKHWLIEVLIFVSLVLLGINAWISYDCYNQLKDDSIGAALARRDVTNFLSASDYLTEQCRLYVITENYEYVENYFYEINELKRRETAMEMLYTNGGQGTKEYHYLEQSYDLSSSLMENEIHAMKLIAYMNNVPEEDMPPQLKDYKLYTGEKEYTRYIQKELANILVFGDIYIHKKENMVKKIDACDNLINTNSIQKRDALSQEMTKHLQIIFLLLAIIVALELISVVFLSIPTDRPAGKARQKKNGGFTIIELIIVLCIIVVLSGILIPAVYMFVQKSKDSKAQQNAMEVKRVTELALVDVLMGDMGDDALPDTGNYYQAFSTQVPAPEKKPGNTLSYTIYNSMNMGGGKYEVIVLINGYRVTQITYKDLDTSRIYVWFDSKPSGSVLQSPQYLASRGKWLIFDGSQSEYWILEYSAQYGDEVIWNGYYEN